MAAAAGLLLAMPGCGADNRQQEQQQQQQELNNERVLRVRAEQKAGQAEQRVVAAVQKAEAKEKETGSWRNMAILAAMGGVVLLIVGAGLGSMGKRDAG
jgi:TolA-binding protein